MEIRGNGQFIVDHNFDTWRILGCAKGEDMPRMRISDVISSLSSLGEVIPQQVYIRRTPYESEEPPRLDELVRLDDYKALFNMKYGETVGVPTTTYAIVQHKEAFTPFLEALEENGVNEISYNIEEHAGRAYMGIWLDHEITPDDGEPVKMGFVIKNSFDGSQSVSFTGAGIRKICGNFNMYGYLFGRASYKHVGDTENIISRLNSFINKLDFQGERILEKINRAYHKPLDYDTAALLVKCFNVPDGYAEAVLSMYNTMQDKTYYGLYKAMTDVASNAKKGDRLNYTFERTISLANIAENILIDLGKSKVQDMLRRKEMEENNILLRY